MSVCGMLYFVEGRERAVRERERETTIREKEDISGANRSGGAPNDHEQRQQWSHYSQRRTHGHDKQPFCLARDLSFRRR